MNSVNAKFESDLEKIVTEIQNHSKQFDELFEIVEDCAYDFAMYKNDNSNNYENLLEELDELAQQILRLQNEMKVKQNIVKSFQQTVTIEGLDKINLLVKFNNQCKHKIKPNTNVSKFDKMKEFRNIVWEELHPGMRKEDDDDNNDIEVEARVETFKCPITQQTYEDPYYSAICKHVFSRSAIMDLLKNSPQINCPFAGCVEKVSLNTLRPDKATRRRMDRQRYLNELQQISTNSTVTTTT